jgi:BirA family biotin operon repressor/biotin-[acetyl-CoA-carboxylase] ligase
LFEIETYQKKLATRWLGQNLIYHPELDSTNTFMKNVDRKEVTHGQICITDFQKKGRGQYERNWEGGRGENLTFTIVFTPADAQRFPVLTLACARAVVAQIDKTIQQKASIKWPNDVYINQKKVTGILTESAFNGNSLDRLLVGIGINMNQVHFSDGVQEKATSLQRVSGEKINREKFLVELLSRIEYEYVLWLKQNTEQLKTINQKMIGYGEWVTLRVDGNILDNKYKLLGINEEGYLTGISKAGGLKIFSYEQIRVIAN